MNLYMGNLPLKMSSGLSISRCSALIFSECMYETWSFPGKEITLAFLPERVALAKATACIWGLNLFEDTDSYTNEPVVLMSFGPRDRIREIGTELYRSSHKTSLTP